MEPLHGVLHMEYLMEYQIDTCCYSFKYIPHASIIMSGTIFNRIILYYKMKVALSTDLSIMYAPLALETRNSILLLLSPE